MPRLTVGGHPLHAVTSDWPVALLSSAAIFDGLYLRTGKTSYATTAYHLQASGLITGLLAGLSGAADYFTISDRQRKLKGDARAHALLNIGLLGLTAAALAQRRQQSVPSGRGPFLLSSLCSLGLLASAWYGGEMIYREGMRVSGVSPVEDSAELAIPLPRGIWRWLNGFSERLAPGTQLH